MSSKNNLNGSILVVDDEESMREFLDIMLSKEGYDIKTAGSVEDALGYFDEHNFDIIISDIRMEGMTGIEFLKKAKSISPNTAFILITAYASLESAVSALREGAFDYITKPFEVSKVKLAINRAMENTHLRKENRILREHIQSESKYLDGFIGISPQIQEIKKYVHKIAPTDSSVLVTGESGTGKEIISKSIHQLSRRNNGSFVAINCAALPEQLLESELFGHVKGSFTGAVKDKEGLFKAADNGTFFMDEIGSTTPGIQVKLLRALEEREITPIGSTKSIPVDVRLLAATNADLASMAEEKEFREDLYYRLNVFHIHIPPLRERREDIIPIAKSFLHKLALRTGEEVKTLSKEAADKLTNSDWKGNVRELENVLERALLLTDGSVIDIDSFPSLGVETPIKKEHTPIHMPDEILPPMETIEKAYIYWVLKSTNWKKSKAADILGIDASTLYRKLEKYDLKDIIGDS